MTVLPAPLRAPRTARWSATLGLGGLAVQLLALAVTRSVHGQQRYGLAATLITAGVLAGVGALVCGGWWLRRVQRRGRLQRRQTATSHPRAARRSERRLVVTGMLTGVVSAGWLIPVAALGLGWILVGS